MWDYLLHFCLLHNHHSIPPQVEMRLRTKNKKGKKEAKKSKKIKGPNNKKMNERKREKEQCSNNDDHHTSIHLQLKDYNSILEQNMTLYGCLWQCVGMCNDSRVTCIKIMSGGFATNTMSTTWSCKQYENDEACHNNGTVLSCMAIYLRMAMEMP